MLGAIVGDIIGSRFEGIKPESLDFELFTEESHFSDDTVLTLAVAKWLMDDPNHTHGGIIKSLRTVGWHHLGAGYGQRFYCWLRSNNPQPYGAWSNGCAMRVSPIGLYAKTLGEALELSKISAKVALAHLNERWKSCPKSKRRPYCPDHGCQIDFIKQFEIYIKNSKTDGQKNM